MNGLNAGNIAYYSMYVLGFVIMLVYSICSAGKNGLTKLKATAYSILTFIYGIAGALIMGNIYSLIASAIGSESGSTVAIFGAVIFTPLFLLATVFIENLINRHFRENRAKASDILDLMTPGIFIILTCAKFGCSLVGCCHGTLCSFGIYRPELNSYVFPVQICEVVCMLLILWLLSTPKLRSVIMPGLRYPVYCILYCITRFIWEFFRYYDSEGMRHLFLGMSLWQGCCIVVIAASSAVIYTVTRKTLKEHKTI